MARTYGERDQTRGRQATVAWLAEEIGELARAVRKGNAEDQLHELGDVLAWLASLSAQNVSPRAQRDAGSMFVREQVVDCSDKSPTEVCVISTSETAR